jgi:hypothetical protein
MSYALKMDGEIIDHSLLAAIGKGAGAGNPLIIAVFPPARLAPILMRICPFAPRPYEMTAEKRVISAPARKASAKFLPLLFVTC